MSGCVSLACWSFPFFCLSCNVTKDQLRTGKRLQDSTNFRLPLEGRSYESESNPSSFRAGRFEKNLLMRRGPSLGFRRLPPLSSLRFTLSCTIMFVLFTSFAQLSATDGVYRRQRRMTKEKVISNPLNRNNGGKVGSRDCLLGQVACADHWTKEQPSVPSHERKNRGRPAGNAGRPLQQEAPLSRLPTRRGRQQSIEWPQP